MAEEAQSTFIQPLTSAHFSGFQRREAAAGHPHAKCLLAVRSVRGCHGHLHLSKTARALLPHKDPTWSYRHGLLICLIWSCWIHLSCNTDRHITLISDFTMGALLGTAWYCVFTHLFLICFYLWLLLCSRGNGLQTGSSESNADHFSKLQRW